MTFFAAHVLISMRKPSEGRLLLHENVYLVEADSAREAWDVAESLGINEMAGYESLEIDEEMAVSKFEGVRKVVEVSQINPGSKMLISGDELTYGEFQVDNSDVIKKLLAAETCTIKILT